MKNGPTVIMLANDLMQQYRARCLANGGNHFFDKSTVRGRTFRK